MSSLRHSLIFCASCAVVVACSGSSSQDVLRGAASSSSGGDAPPSSATSSGGAGGSSGTSSGNASGGTPDGGGDCPAESEPNDRRNDANELAPMRCGTVSKDDPRDVLTFTLKPTTKNLSLRFEGRVRLKVEIGGRDAATLTPDSFPPIPIEPSEVYVIEIEPLTPSERDIDWLVELIES